MKQNLLIAVCLLITVLAVWRLVAVLRDRPDRSLQSMPALDLETGHQFHVPMEHLAPWPIESPKTGKRTAYPATICQSEVCKARGGTWVVRNELLGKPGLTTCPECGHTFAPLYSEPSLETP